MDSQAKLRKMLEIIILMSGNLRYTIDEIAQKADITQRTVYRYIDTFKQAGLVLSNNNGYINIDRQNSEFKDISQLLHFSEEEGFILSRAIHAIDDNHVIKANLVRKLYSLYNFDRVAQTIIKKEHSETVHNIIQAIHQNKQVELLNYQSANSQTIYNRVIEPFAFTTNYIAIWAFEPKTQQNKLFKTARVGAVNILQNNWQYKNLHNQGFIDVFRISSLNKTNVVFDMRLRAKNLLIEEYPLAEQYITKLDNYKYRFNGFVCNFEGVARFILGLCNEVDIIEPNELVLFINQKIKQSTFL